MKITIKNNHLKKVVEFLETLELSGKASRVRVKLNTRLQEKLQEFSIEYTAIVNEFDELKQQEKYEVLKDKLAESNELLNEPAVVDMTEYEHLLGSLKDELENYQGALQGDSAIAHDVLLDALEDNLPSSPVATEHSEEAQYTEIEEVKQTQEVK